MHKFVQFPLVRIVFIAAIVLFICSSLRHALFQSTAFDLGIFDNAIYLISQGKEPFVSFRGLHILGDHAAWILYPLAGLYKIHGDVHWLFAIQALTLASGAFPTWYLAIQAGLNRSQAYGIAIAYLLYPVVFNANLFDFHPEVIAIPFILLAIWATRAEKLWCFIGSIIIILGCKAVLGLTVVGMGLWLLMTEKKHFYGVLAIFLGTIWFIIATQLIIPTFSGEEVAAVGRYDFLGNSLSEIATNLIFQPGLVLGRVFTLDNLWYLILLFAPFLWGLSLKHLSPMIGAMPILFLNLLTDYQLQKDLIHQYSLPILPFLLVAVISNLAVGGGLIRSQKGIIVWSLIAWLALGKIGYFGSKYLQSIDTQVATRIAISHITTKEAVLAPAKVIPHLSHRSVIKIIDNNIAESDLSQFQYVIINSRHYQSNISPESVDNLLSKLTQSQDFILNFQQDDVFLFTKIAQD
ncbi:MAG: DUF2079 domain-containing protein [Xenococcaceae cyanobacterium MO_188.B19]|nr:DUF2079 domain-containing protein [Xenococcaceae cyanobacterium MO_188.B19]